MGTLGEQLKTQALVFTASLERKSFGKPRITIPALLVNQVSHHPKKY